MTPSLVRMSISTSGAAGIVPIAVLSGLCSGAITGRATTSRIVSTAGVCASRSAFPAAWTAATLALIFGLPVQIAAGS